MRGEVTRGIRQSRAENQERKESRRAREYMIKASGIYRNQKPGDGKKISEVGEIGVGVRSVQMNPDCSRSLRC